MRASPCSASYGRVQRHGVWVDPEELKGHDFATTLALSCLPLAMMAVLLATVFCGWLFQGRRTLGSWTLAFKVSTRRIAQLFATSSPP